MKTGKIDQVKRVRLCRLILDGDRSAAEQLALLYDQAGYRTLARAIRLSNDGARKHAQTILS